MRYHSYLSFDIEQSIRGLSPAQLAEAKNTFVSCLESQVGVSYQSYATLGFKPGTRFMLHLNAQAPDMLQAAVRDLLHTSLGVHLRITYSLLGLTRSSQYNPHKAPKESAPEAPHRYLVVYPFSKTIDWHLLPYDERRRIMGDHVAVGKKYSERISQLLLYSYGIDDQEFIVSYQMDDLEEFQTLVMELRGTEGRRHTQNDLPIFTATHMPLQEALDML